VLTIVILALALVVNFIVTIISGTNENSKTLFNAAFYVHMVTWIIQLIVCINFCRIFLYTSAIKDEEVSVFLNNHGQVMITQRMGKQSKTITLKSELTYLSKDSFTNSEK